MEEKIKEQAHELNERKREIEELQHELLLLKQPKGVEADSSTVGNDNRNIGVTHFTALNFTFDFRV